jgi:hypothetical protein
MFELEGWLIMSPNVVRWRIHAEERSPLLDV